jgi:hypothetical protein
VLHLEVGVLAKNNARDAYSFTAVAAKNSSKTSGFGDGGH